MGVRRELSHSDKQFCCPITVVNHAEPDGRHQVNIAEKVPTFYFFSSFSAKSGKRAG